MTVLFWFVVGVAVWAGIRALLYLFWGREQP